MADKYYDIYFDRNFLKVDGNGHLENWEILQVIEFEYDEDTEEVTSCRRVNEKGELIEENPNLSELEHVGDGDDPTIREAYGRFYGWLDDHLVWTELYAATRWEPAEYTCIGIEGCIPTWEDAKWDWWDNGGGKEQTLYGL